MTDNYVKAIELTEGEKIEFRRIISESNAYLRDKASSYGLEKPKDFRKLYLNNDGQFDDNTTKVIQSLVELEERVIAGYVRLASQLASSFYLTHRNYASHLDEADYLQEACRAILNSIYNYDGSNEFSTYCYWAVKKWLIQFVRSQENFAKIGKKVKKFRQCVKVIMREKLCSFDAALEKLQESERFDDKMAMQIRNAYHARTVHSHNWDKTESIHEEYNLKEFVEKANLNSIQRELIESFLENGKRIDSELVHNRINPRTGKKFTRQALSQQWIDACEKIKKVIGKNNNLLKASA